MANLEASASSSKGHKVALSTFKSWEKESVIGYKTEIDDVGRTYVNFIYWLVCCRNKEATSGHPSCKGEAKKAMLAYVEGTNFVTKHTLTRHLTSKAHGIALEAERSKPTSDVTIVSDTNSSQPNITTNFRKASVDVYKKMFSTAYELAMVPSMPFKHFHTLVKYQRMNGVRLVQGKDDHRARC